MSSRAVIILSLVLKVPRVVERRSSLGSAFHIPIAHAKYDLL